MIESLRIFGLLLYKSWLVRKRHWIATSIGEILVPVGLVALIWSVSTSEFFNRPPQEIKTDSHYKAHSLEELIDLIPDYNNFKFAVGVYYVPKNDFINKLIAMVQECTRLTGSIKGFATEKEFMAFWHRRKQFFGAAVIFDESLDESAKHLRYKLRYAGKTLPLYNEKAMPTDLTWHYTQANFLAQAQICIDRSFVKMKSGNKTIPDMYIQRMPYPAHIQRIPFDGKLRTSIRNTMVVAYMFPLFIETAKATNEKFIGVNVLMSMNGISNTLNLLSWLISGYLFLSVFFAIPILLLLTNSPNHGLSFLYYGNPLLLYFILIFYLAHLLTFGIHVSAYFSKALFVTTGILIITVLTVILQVYAFTEDTLYLAPYVGIILPNILILQAVDEIRSYENIAEGIQWHNLFTNADLASKVGGSVGMVLILSAIGTIFHFSLAIYIYAINPGKYGVAKHPFYFLKRKPIKKENYDDTIDSLRYDGINDQYFESASADVYVPGIQIRNLKKDYTINLFTKEKVHALRGISVDFYKGQITSLLGHNGAGKTTMISILTGMTSPTDGTVLIDSKNLKENASEIMNDMGLCTQENMYFASLTVLEQLMFFAMVKRKGSSRSSVRGDVEALLQKLKLSHKKDAVPDTLSGGQKRRLCLGMALVADTSTLILDEPTSGLDPESRRVIWDILLRMRGQKTILISTHDMEEADILGDRIAIMHTAQLKSYGTSLFLKRLIGQNNVEITLSIGPRSDPEKIRSELHKEGIIVKKDATKMVVKIPNSPALPDTLDNLEKKKAELGVSGFSVSLISLEQVFLKMTRENDDPLDPHQSIDIEETKLVDTALYAQTLRALSSKKLIYALRDYPTIIIKIITIVMALLIEALILRGINKLEQFKERERPINLGMYHEAHALYTSYDGTLGDRYKTVGEIQGGNPTEVTDRTLDSALLRRAKENLVFYDNHLIAGAEFNKSSANAFYSEATSFSLPVSINLLWNTIVKNLAGPEYSISLSSQVLLSIFIPYLDLSESFGYVGALAFASIFCLTVAMFVVHPLRESTTGIKHMQKMTGISGLSYWGTIFIFDLMEYALLMVLVIIGFVCIDLSLGLRMFGPIEILIEILLFLLFGINTLPFIYLFSFLKIKASAVVRLAMYIPAGIVVMDIIMSILADAFEYSNGMHIFRLLQKSLCLLLPCVSFSHSMISFFVTVHKNARCHRLPNDFYDTWCKFQRHSDDCCRFGCHDGKCKRSKPFFDDEYEDVNLTTSVIYLCVTPILYFGILAAIESKFIEKFMSKRVKHDVVEPNDDEQVQQEKSIIFERIQTLTGIKPSSINNVSVTNEQAQLTENSLDNQVFIVYELRKSYKTVKAVKDVSFGVNSRECFGLLGVNGAGKSTTFRMMTGGEIPDHGIMYIGDKDFENDQNYFLSQMGYCPQHNANLGCLNAYEHLRLFARLRGIPESYVESKVHAWVERLNLTACATQPSGTYSGGNKRRLNIAIALIGKPNLILMDEPTTGVDPGARRSLWNVIKTCQMAGQAVVLTSHSMVECEALCDRLAIMVDGKLVCIGASEQLKQRFGAGYDIQIRMNPEKAKDQVDGIKNDVAEALNCVLTDENLGYLMYHVEHAGTTWRKMYNVMNEVRSKYDCIDDFLVLSSSLEQLFLLFAKTSSENSSSQPID